MHDFIAGLLLGAGVGGHVLRLVMLHQETRSWSSVAAEVSSWREGREGLALAENERLVEWKRRISARMFVAGGAVGVYAMASVLTLLDQDMGLWIAAVGPVIGVSAVLVFRARIDAFQVALGVFQVLSGVLAVWELVS